jgi:hypothetical protein
MKYLYKYPQAAIRTATRRTRTDMECELLDSGVFKDDRYFDVFVEHAETLWFRNDWSKWTPEEKM